MSKKESDELTPQISRDILEEQLKKAQEDLDAAETAPEEYDKQNKKQGISSEDKIKELFCKKFEFDGCNKDYILDQKDAMGRFEELCEFPSSKSVKLNFKLLLSR
jgi:hypothetical protein